MKKNVRPAGVYLAAMLGIFPLYYQNFYFNINTCKYFLFLWLTLALAAASLIQGAYRLLKGRGLGNRISVSEGALYAFVCCALVSCLLSTDPVKAFTGELGRRSGLLYLLAIAGMTLCLARGSLGYRACLGVFMLSGAAVCLLGVLNFYYVDPLGFYASIDSGQGYIFISTIGHINFFGAFVALVLAFALAGAIDAERGGVRIACQALTLICFVAAIASRSDSVFIAIAAALVALLRRMLASFKTLARALLAAAWFFAAGWIVALLPPAHRELAGLSAIVVGLGAALPALGALCLAGCLTAGWLAHSGKCARGPIRALRPLYLFVGLFAACALLAVIWFTAFDRKTPLGALSNYLRLDEMWGTARGFAWMCAVKSYAGFSPLQKLFGCGPDMVRSVLASQMTPEVFAVSGGVFENCHNEYLQYLLTTGALGLYCYVSFLATALIRLARAGRRDAAARALFAATLGYASQAFVSVNQPITTTIFFVLLAAGLGWTGHIARRQAIPN